MKKSILSGTVLFGLWALNALAAPPDYVAQGEKGIKAFSEGNLIEAMHLLGESAEQGYAPAQATLAYILDKSNDDDKAFQLYLKAAEQGNAAGQYGLANMYAKGEGTEQNLTEAARWLQRSAEQDHKLAMRDLATALERGEFGVKSDSSRALDWYRRCSEAGDDVCTRRLAQAYKRGELGLMADEETSKQLFGRINKKTDDD